MKFIKLRSFAEEENSKPTPSQPEVQEQNIANNTNSENIDKKETNKPINQVITQKVNEDGSIEKSFKVGGFENTYKWNPKNPEMVSRKTSFDGKSEENSSARGYLIDPSKMAHGEVSGIYGQKQIEDNKSEPSILMQAVKGGKFRNPHKAMEGIALAQEGDQKARTWNIDAYWQNLADMYNKQNGTSFTGNEVKDIVIGGAGRKRVEYDVSDFRTQEMPESQIEAYKQWYSDHPDMIPFWRDRTGDIVAAHGLMEMNEDGSPWASNILKSTYSEDEEDGRHPNALGYAWAAKRFDNKVTKTHSEGDGGIHLRSPDGKQDTSMLVGPHEISHVLTATSLPSVNLFKNKNYRDFNDKSIKRFYEDKIDEAYASTVGDEKSRMWNELKLKLFMNGDVKPENIHDFRYAAPKLLQYFDEFDNDPQYVEMLLHTKPEFKPLLESYYQFKNLYNGDRNAWYNGEFKNYETAKNGRNAWQQGGNNGWLNTTPRTGLQRLTMGSIGVPA